MSAAAGELLLEADEVLLWTGRSASMVPQLARTAWNLLIFISLITIVDILVLGGIWTPGALYSFANRFLSSDIGVRWLEAFVAFVFSLRFLLAVILISLWGIGPREYFLTNKRLFERFRGRLSREYGHFLDLRGDCSAKAFWKYTDVVIPTSQWQPGEPERCRFFSLSSQDADSLVTTFRRLKEGGSQ